MDTSKLKIIPVLIALLCGKIQCIKKIREVLGIGLKDAKDLCESLFYTGPDVDPRRVDTFFGITGDAYFGLEKVLRDIAKGQAYDGSHDVCRDEERRLESLLESSQDCVRDLHQTNEELMRDNQDLRDKLSDQGEVDEMQETIQSQDRKISKMEKIIEILMND